MSTITVQRVGPWLAALAAAGLAATACEEESGADEGRTLEGHWSGGISCDGTGAYDMSFDLDGAGGVSGVTISSNFTSSLCPGGSGLIQCGGSGDYSYKKSGAAFHMDVDYAECTCGGVQVDMLTSDSFDGTFDGADTLTGSVGCDFTFVR